LNHDVFDDCIEQKIFGNRLIDSFDGLGNHRLEVGTCPGRFKYWRFWIFDERILIEHKVNIFINLHKEAFVEDSADRCRMIIAVELSIIEL